VLEVLRQSIGASTLGVGLVAALNMWIVQHAIPSDSPWLQWLDESKVVVTVLGGFLSFLLVFRTIMRDGGRLVATGADCLCGTRNLDGLG